MSTFSLFTVAVAVAFTLSASSASETPLKLTTDQGIALALERNHFLKAARNIVEQARAREEGSGRWQRPEIGVSYGNDAFFNNEGESTLSVSLKQSIPITSRLNHLRRISQMEIELAEAEIRNQERLLAEQVELAMIELAHLEAQRIHRNELIALNEKLADFIDSRVDLAESSPIEANQVRIEQGILERDLIILNRESHAILAELSLLLGLRRHAAIDIQIDFEIPAAPPHIHSYTKEELVEHPAYLLKSKLVDIASQKSQLAQVNRWDDISVELFLKNERSVDIPNGLGSNKSLGLGVSIPLPSRKRFQAANRETRSRWQQAEDTLDATGIALDANALHIQEEIFDIYRQAEHYRNNLVPLIEENVQGMDNAYRSGLVDLPDLFRAYEQQLVLKSEYLQTVRDFLQAYAEWHSATGRNIE